MEQVYEDTGKLLPKLLEEFVKEHPKKRQIK